MARAAPFLVLLVGVIAASSSSILIRYAQQEGIASLAIAAWRMALAMLVLLPLALVTRRRELRALNRRDGVIAALAGLFLSAHFLSWITSLEYTSVASSAALVTTNPIWVGLATVLIFRERLPRQTVVGIAISLLGCLLILWADLGPGAGAAPADLSAAIGEINAIDGISVRGRQPALGNGLALLGALCVSVYLLTGRSLASRLSLIAYVTLVYGAAAVALMFAAALAGVELWRYSTFGWWMLAGLALGPQLVGHTAFNWALRRLSATFVALSILGEPVGSAILAGFLFAEVPSTGQLVAFAILLVGIAVAALGERNAASALSSPADIAVSRS